MIYPPFPGLVRKEICFAKIPFVFINSEKYEYLFTTTNIITAYQQLSMLDEVLSIFMKLRYSICTLGGWITTTLTVCDSPQQLSSATSSLVRSSPA